MNVLIDTNVILDAVMTRTPHHVSAEKLFSLFEVLDVTGSDCEKALSMPMNDYGDALLATCAKRRKLDLIITRNLKDFAESPIKAIAPDDFLANYF